MAAGSWSSPGRRTPDSADSAFCVRGQLALEPPCLPGKRYAVYRSHPRLVPMNTQSGILCDAASLVLYGRCQPVRDLMRDLEKVNRGEPRANRLLHSNRELYNPHMRGPWSTIPLGLLLLISACSIGGQEVQSPQPEKSKPPVKMEQRGRILGIGGVFFNSPNIDQRRARRSKL